MHWNQALAFGHNRRSGLLLQNKKRLGAIEANNIFCYRPPTWRQWHNMQTWSGCAARNVVRGSLQNGGVPLSPLSTSFISQLRASGVSWNQYSGVFIHWETRVGWGWGWGEGHDPCPWSTSICISKQVQHFAAIKTDMADWFVMKFQTSIVILPFPTHLHFLTWCIFLNKSSQVEPLTKWSRSQDSKWTKASNKCMTFCPKLAVALWVRVQLWFQQMMHCAASVM